MDMEIIETETTCPRCKKAKVRETYIGGRPVSFQCLNPDKTVCGKRFVGEIRHNFEKRQVEFWGAAENPAYYNDNKTLEEGILFIGKLQQQGIPFVLANETYLFRARQVPAG